ncbi:glycosyltransferase [Herbiconiux sp. CPCC 205716]|uniref:Glycosyltransferase n=1 Tax=Herbiconiux gentiana TaxID=2970912 RepID=A0ABT2GLN2_9MICO|nr:glycosyltransferase [Herbiconiux gentiana]MCS5716190.1 glycosyltransferase [Herbiconiux gentiana]
MSDEVVAVVTAFAPGPRLAELVRALVPQTARVVVVDDSGATDARPAVLAAESAGATVVRHPTNRGIAAALNTGAREARAVPGARHLLTFDEDSGIDDGFVDALVGALDTARGAGIPAGLAAPAAVSGQPAPAVRTQRGILIGRTPIQSGLLVPFSTLDEVGGFAEGLFIDGVDTDYALRVAGAGLAVVHARGTELAHSLGRRHTATVAGRRVELTHSAPFRYYYLARNRVLLNRRRGLYRGYRPVRDTLADLRHLVIVSLFVPGRGTRLRAAARGLVDGWAGRTGRIPRDLEARLSRV